MRFKAAVLLAASFIGATVAVAQTFGTKQRMPRPNEYGNVELNYFAEDAGMAPVLFTHWFHRSRYTCRLCHVDLGFAMEAGMTGIREDDIRNGIYCGACHNGEEAFAAEEKLSRGQTQENCDRCHSVGKDIEPEHGFYDLVRGFPRARFGNRVDWMLAEDQGLIRLSDYLEGVSIRREALEVPLDVDIDATVAEMPDIIFSHEKHAVWSGCELCHPQIFSVKKAGTVYEMQDIFEGRFCGACHDKVAFMTLDCQLCHTKSVH